ncbi:hypothetical protein SAMN05216174_1011083 [Actinokineospora iranica]|uniref:Glycosyltransferase subfamily 4-like N-terminal domain-containing protein n=1 Tax=Actinokineospora iranica TaxID=1271860 RepID=A0A1G6KSR8_9PSEU|nr:hypothetical protein [Actinokineospora iranica]SDC34152.1 hypothetical protein SAMN05216174_1011083 [Actinokineospora iranica]
MRIGYVLMEFPPLTETFIRREIAALCGRGDSVVVYAEALVDHPLSVTAPGPGLTVRHVPFQRRPGDLSAAARRDGVAHLHGSLKSDSHRATQAAANALGLPYTITAYSGRDIFTVSEPELYQGIARDPACRAIVVEDEFMAGWMVDRFAIPRDRLALVANPIDLEVYRPEIPRRGIPSSSSPSPGSSGRKDCSSSSRRFSCCRRAATTSSCGWSDGGRTRTTSAGSRATTRKSSFSGR